MDRGTLSAATLKLEKSGTLGCQSCAARSILWAYPARARSRFTSVFSLRWTGGREEGHESRQQASQAFLTIRPSSICCPTIPCCPKPQPSAHRGNTLSVLIREVMAVPTADTCTAGHGAPLERCTSCGRRLCSPAQKTRRGHTPQQAGAHLQQPHAVLDAALRALHAPVWGSQGEEAGCSWLRGSTAAGNTLCRTGAGRGRTPASHAHVPHPIPAAPAHRWRQRPVRRRPGRRRAQCWWPCRAAPGVGWSRAGGAQGWCHLCCQLHCVGIATRFEHMATLPMHTAPLAPLLYRSTSRPGAPHLPQAAPKQQRHLLAQPAGGLVAAGQSKRRDIGCAAGAGAARGRGRGGTRGAPGRRQRLQVAGGTATK